MGRTMFALNLFKNICAEGEHNAVFLTAECPDYKAIKLLKGMMENENYDMSDRIIDVATCEDVQTLFNIIRQVVEKQKVDVVILDSFHYLTLIDNFATPFLYESLADITRRMKQLAKKLSITIIMTSRTNYMDEERHFNYITKRPLLSDTDKMGDLAYYSDVVLGLYRPEVDSILVDTKGNDLHTVLYVLILKSRRRIEDQLVKFTMSSKNCNIAEVEKLPMKEYV